MKFDEIQLLDDIERLIILRKRLNMKQYQFAHAIGISTSYLGQVERGKVPLNKSVKKRIEDFINKELEVYGFDILGDRG